MDKAAIDKFIKKSEDTNRNFSLSPDRIADRERFENAPHCWVLGAVMDRGIPFAKAWDIPYEIARREFGGDTGFSYFASLSHDDYIRIFNTPPYLHRYINKMAECFFLVVQKIKNDFNSDPRKIWESNKSSFEVISLFKEFKGVGDKIATMACNALYRDLGVEFSDLRAINVSPDVHVQRVFYRLGLTNQIYGDPLGSMNIARRLNPEFPGVFDLLCWLIGEKRICVNDIKKSKCIECALNEICIKKN